VAPMWPQGWLTLALVVQHRGDSTAGWSREGWSDGR
jgi:hypothetical protein